MSQAIEDLKRKHRLEDVVEHDLGAPARRSYSRLYWFCPFHQERKSPSFVVFRDTDSWFCFGACQAGGDVLEYIKRRDKTDFRGAYRTLAGEDLPSTSLRSATRPRRSPPVRVATAPGEAWQGQAWGVVIDCQAELWGPLGGAARAYLHERRGLTDETLQHWCIGFNHAGGKHNEGSRRHGLWVWRGIVLPIYQGDTMWRIKVRCPEDDPKYKNVKPDGAAFLWGADNLAGQTVAILCESEFDALLLWQAAGDLVAVVAQGSAGEAKIANVHTWLPYLWVVQRLYVATDADPAGQRAADFWMERTQRAQRVLPPLGENDLTDSWCAGADLRAWVEEVMA